MARAVFLLAGLALVGRLVQLQVFLNPRYAAIAEEQILQRVAIPGERGKIYDRRGRVLARNQPTVRVEVDLPMAGDRDKLVEKLASVLPMTRQEIARRVNQRAPGRVRVVAYHVPATEAVVNGLKRIRGVRTLERSEREYCFGVLAGQVIGAVDVDGVGLEGVEKDFDEELGGRAGEALEERTAKVELPTVGEEGKVRERLPIVASQRKVVREANHGNSLFLTLDMDIQAVVEKVAAETQARLKGRSVTAIVMNPHEGDILAMATLPGFERRDRGRDMGNHPERRINTGVWWRYEPGSTFKPFVVAAALEEGKVTLGDTFLCTGHRMLGGRAIRCWTEGQGRPPHGRLALNEVLAQSCNVGMMSVVERLGQTSFSEYFHKFGFDETLLDNCSSERPGSLREPPFSRGDFLRFGFGQGYLVTPLGLATAYCTLANGGEMVRPRLVRKIVECDTLVPRVSEPQVVRRVVSEETAREVLAAMVLTVEKGTGKAARIEGVKVAGKTGTAEKAETGKGFKGGKRVVSFAAIFPADAQRHVVLVVVDEPKGAASGGTVAAPAARLIAEAILALERADAEGKSLVASRKATSETG